MLRARSHLSRPQTTNLCWKYAVVLLVLNGPFYDVHADHDPLNHRTPASFETCSVSVPCEDARWCSAPAGDDFTMQVNAWFHLRHTYFDSSGPNPDANDCSFERLRLSFQGDAYFDSLQYFIQLDGNSDRATDAIFIDYFIAYDAGRELFDLPAERLMLRLGKYKMPFSRSRTESGRRLQFSERTAANEFFDLNRSLGVGVVGQLGCENEGGWFGHPVRFETALLNGFETGSVSTSRAAVLLDRNLGASMRITANLLHGVDAGEPDLTWHDLPGLEIGAGMAYSHVDSEGLYEFAHQSAVDSGVSLASLLPAGVDSYDMWFYTVDAHLKYRGLSLIAEYYWRYLTEFDADLVPDLLDDGYVVQLGRFLVAERLELLARWSRITGNSGTLGAMQQSSDEIGAGIAWYLNGYRAKLVFDATHINGSPISNGRLDMLPGDVGWLFRSQFQLAL